MREYTFQVTIREGSDEFWESLEGDGINEVKKALEGTLEESGWINSEVTLKEFKRN
jgi:hypothetical protein